MKRFVWFCLVVVLTLAVVVLLWQFRQAILLFIFSLAIAAVFRPAIAFLVQKHVPRPLAILFPYLLGLGTVLGLIVLAAGPLTGELQQLTNDFTNTYTTIRNTWPSGSDLQKSIVSQLPPLADLYRAVAGQQGAVLSQSLLGFATNLFDVLSSLIIVIVLSIYWSVDHDHFERFWLSTLPAEQRSGARTIWRSIEQGVGNYMRSEIIQSLLTAIILALVYRLIGLPYPTLLAIIGALAWLIPWLGAVLALVPPLLIGLSTSLELGFMGGLVTVGVLILMEAVVEPRFFNRRRYSSLLVMVLVIALADVYGLIGLILAPPLAAAIQIFFNYFQGQASTQVAVDPATQISGLRTQLTHVREKASRLDQSSPQNINLMERLSRLIDETEDVVQADALAENR